MLFVSFFLAFAQLESDHDFVFFFFFAGKISDNNHGSQVQWRGNPWSRFKNIYWFVVKISIETK
jgi:hypothetical protein